MTSTNYLETVSKQSQEKFNLMKERMLEPIKQVQQARQESLMNLLNEIEKNSYMKEVIILEVNEPRKSHLVQDFLKQKKIDYRILAEAQPELNANSKEKEREKEQLKKRLITAYQRQAKNKKLQSELALWDSISGDGLNDR